MCKIHQSERTNEIISRMHKSIMILSCSKNKNKIWAKTANENKSYEGKSLEYPRMRGSKEHVGRLKQTKPQTEDNNFKIRNRFLQLNQKTEALYFGVWVDGATRCPPFIPARCKPTARPHWWLKVICRPEATLTAPGSPTSSSSSVRQFLALDFFVCPILLTKLFRWEMYLMMWFSVVTVLNSDSFCCVDCMDLNGFSLSIRHIVSSKSGQSSAPFPRPHSWRSEQMCLH